MRITGNLSVLSLLFVLQLFFTTATNAAKVTLDPENWGLPEGEECVSCHKKASSGLHQQWKQGAHAEAGVNCLDCHQADEADDDAHEHEGVVIATIVSPKDCGRCHTKEYQQARGSIHNNALALLKERTGASDSQIIEAGCSSCHGSKVEVAGDGTLMAGSWPNSGIGRVNPDGSKGSCSACHGRHQFSKAQAREPATCGTCHSGNESPDMEIYNSSKHGVLFASQREKMNLGNDSWVVGKDYSATATCVTCHMGAAPGLHGTHDVGMRDAWSLNGPVSERQSLVIFSDGDSRDLPQSHSPLRKGDSVAKIGGEMGTVKAVASHKRRRKAMSKVCYECHSKSFVKRFMSQFDRQVENYNLQFGVPGKAIMDALYAANLLTPAPFDEPLEQIWWNLWHNQGVRLRHAAAMASPALAHSNGMQQLGQSFYGEFLPVARSVAGEELADELINRYLHEAEQHRWLNNEEASPPLLGYGMGGEPQSGGNEAVASDE